MGNRRKDIEHWMHHRPKALHQIDHFLTTKDKLHRFYDAGITAPILGSDHQAILLPIAKDVDLKS